MSYIDGFVAAVPVANKEAYRKHAADALPYFKEFGATRMVENWGDDVPDGKLTDFKRSVKAKPDEAIDLFVAGISGQGHARRSERHDDG